MVDYKTEVSTLAAEWHLMHSITDAPEHPNVFEMNFGHGILYADPIRALIGHPAFLNICSWEKGISLCFLKRAR